MSALLALAERCEREEPSRELNSFIADVAGIRSRSRRTAGGVIKGREWLVDAHGGVEEWAHHPPPYTTSLDAAATLLPDGWTVEGSHFSRHYKQWFVDLYGIEGDARSMATTEAMARCAAALRARAAVAEASVSPQRPQGAEHSQSLRKVK